MGGMNAIPAHNDYVNHIYRAQVVRYVDGDSFHVLLTFWPSKLTDVGFGLQLDGHGILRLEVRVNGCDAPDVPHNAEKKAASAYLASLIPLGSFVRAQTLHPLQGNGFEKYGRWLTDIWLADGRRLDQTMIEAGHAVPYHGGTR